MRAAAQQWLSVVTAGATRVERGSAVAGGRKRDVRQHARRGAPGARNQVVLFAADQAATGSVTSAAVQRAASDARPRARRRRAVERAATPSRPRRRAESCLIRVSAGGPHQASANKTLSFSVSAAGAVSGARRRHAAADNRRRRNRHPARRLLRRPPPPRHPRPPRRRHRPGRPPSPPTTLTFRSPKA